MIKGCQAINMEVNHPDFVHTLVMNPRAYQDVKATDDYMMGDPRDLDLPDMEGVSNPGVDFMTLGMLIIDEIEYQPPKPPVGDILGGAGIYSALGARLFSPPPISKSVSLIVDRGSDFPKSMSTLLDSWHTSAYIRDDPNRLTTRAWNGCSPDGAETRSFRYTTTKLRLGPNDLTSEQLASRSFHIVSTPARCRDIVETLNKLRRHLASVLPPGRDARALKAQLSSRPFIIWEPVPDCCVPDELLNVTNTLRLVDVCSPNHAELAGLMGDTTLGCEDPTTGRGVSRVAVERACEQLLASMPLQSFSIVVRCGEAGCYVAGNGGRKRGIGGSSKKKKRVVAMHGGLQPETDMMSLFAGLMQDGEGFVAREEIEIDPGMELWFPAYHGNGNDGKRNGNGQANGAVGMDGDAGDIKVVDPTGGGDAFLGGLGVALARGKTVEEAAVYGSVAASFAIEQVGVPVLGKDEEGRETWNGVRVEERLEKFMSRVGMA